MNKSCKNKNPGQFLSGFILRQQSNIPGVKGVPATLKDIIYDCQILNNILMVEMKQVFKSSDLDCFSESFYEVSVQEGGCFETFEATFDGKKVVGVVKSKEDANKEYIQEKLAGSLVSYAEIEQKNISEQLVKIKLGNLPPKSEVEIRIKFSHQVTSLLNSFYAVKIPLIFIEQEQNSERSNQPFLTLQLTCTGSITYCESKGYPVQTEKVDTNTYKIALSSAYVQQDTPFSLVYGYEGMYEPQSIFGMSRSRKPENAAKYQESPFRESVFVSFLPAFNATPAVNEGSIEAEESTKQKIISNQNIKDKIIGCSDIFSDEQQAQILDEEGIDHMESSKSEFIFLLDRSGSMSGTPFTKAIQALTLFLQSLPNDSYFNVVGFGTSFKKLFPSSIKYNQDSLKKALKSISSYKADLGGTEIFKPLEKIFQSAKIEETYNRQIFLLTDGEVEQPQTVLELIKRHRQYSRVHSIGIGSSADRHLIEESARIGRGQSRIMDLAADFSDEIVSLLSECITPSLDNFKIEYDENVFESAFPDPRNIPCVFKDEIFNLHLFMKLAVKIDEIADESKIVKISYFDSKLKRTVESIVRIQTNDAFLCNESLRETTFKLGKQLELNQRIEDLEYGSQNNKGKAEKLQSKEQLTQESVEFQILNKLTAMICVVHKLNDAEVSQFNETKHDVVFKGKSDLKNVLEQQKKQQLEDWEKNHLGHPFLQQYKSQSDPKIKVNRHSKVLSIPKRLAPQFDPQLFDADEDFEMPEENANKNPNLNKRVQNRRYFQSHVSFMQLSGQERLNNLNSMESIKFLSEGNSIGQKEKYYKDSDKADSNEFSDDNEYEEAEEDLQLDEAEEESGERSRSQTKKRGRMISMKTPKMQQSLDSSSNNKKKLKRASPKEDESITKKKLKLSKPKSNVIERELKKSEEQVVLNLKIQLSELLNLIESNGLCRYSEKICLMYLSQNDLQQLQTQNQGLSQNVLMAGFILTVLKEYFSKDKNKWNLIAKKALSWAKLNVVDVNALNKLQEDILKRVIEHAKK